VWLCGVCAGRVVCFGLEGAAAKAPFAKKSFKTSEIILEKMGVYVNT